MSPPSCPNPSLQALGHQLSHVITATLPFTSRHLKVSEKCVRKPFYFNNVMRFQIQWYLVRINVGQDTILTIRKLLDCESGRCVPKSC